MTSNTIKDFLTNKYKNLSASTIKLYSIKLNQLSKYFNTEFDEDLLLNFPNIINYIKNLDVSTDNKLAFFNAIILIVRDSENNEVFYTLQKYIDARNKLNAEKFNKYKDNYKKSNFEEYNKLLELSREPDFKNNSIKEIIDKMNLYLSIRYPLRLSLYNIYITRTKKDLDESKNYLYATPRNMYFLMNNFKNVKTLGKQEIQINKDHQKVIKEYLKWLKKNKLENKLLWNYNLRFNKPIEYLSSDLYAINLKRLFKELNLNITMNDIRKAYETKLINSTEYKEMTNRQKEKEHLKLLHSPQIANLVYNKV